MKCTSFRQNSPKRYVYTLVKTGLYASCVKNPCQTQSMPADFFLVIEKIMLENPHIKIY